MGKELKNDVTNLKTGRKVERKISQIPRQNE